MARLGLLMIVFMMVAGCATTEKFEEELQQRIGQNINAVIDELGPPENTFKKPNGDIVYTWINQGSTRATASHVFMRHEVDIQKRFCKISYTVSPDGKVRKWHHEGTICKSR